MGSFDPKSAVNVGGEVGFQLLHGVMAVGWQEGRPFSGSSEFFVSLNLWIQSLLVSVIPGHQLNGVDNEGVIGSGEKVSRHIDALLVLNDEMEF